jgi:hypothetical protein
MSAGDDALDRDYQASTFPILPSALILHKLKTSEVYLRHAASLVGWVEACGETQHPAPLSRVFGIHKIAGFHSLRGSTQPCIIKSSEHHE